jgi:rod shape-determining protein MreC
LIDIRRSTTFLFLLACLCNVLLISWQVQSKSGGPLLASVDFNAYAPVARGSSSLVNGAASLWGRYVALHGVVAENEQLRAEISRLQGELQQKDALAGQSRSLEAALQLQTSVAQRTRAARVIAGDPSPGSLTIMIDRGSADGLKPDLGVIASGGVVGRVMGELAPHTARIQIITGRGAAVGALLERVAAEAIVVGGSDSQLLQMQFVNKSYDVKPGDRVITSGHDLVFPAGFAVGTVEKVDRSTSVHQVIVVRPAVSFSHLDIVLVLLDTPPGAGAGEVK